MSTLVSSFLHRDDVSTVINGKSGEIRKKGQTFRRRALTDTMANLHKRFLSENQKFERLRSLRETLTQNDVVIHIDYSENYACKYSREIKETHFGGGNQQVTLHTGVLYLGGGKVESFASLSACLQHDATATWAHLDPVLRGI